ncbi:AAA family ATPase [Sphingomonas aerolata]|uniref:AAA family ATPase n=1 Tax=Sphingomonas aerolata TaxID=185951 RepID=UPI00208E06D5|nr:AAA family ATPase [Sphingomonas aerolata]USR02401.1 AAA family ATPase [Sphingomonas aerolata]
MFLRRLTLENIRSIEALTLDFSGGREGRQWTYLLGENGTGKSSVLKAIALVMAGSESIYDLVRNPDEWIRLGKNTARIAVDFATQEGEVRHAEVTFSRGAKASEFIKRNTESLERVDRAVAKSDRNYFVVGYGVVRHALGPSARGTALEAMPRSFASRTRAVSTLFNLDTALVSLESWAMDLEYRRGPQGLSAVRSALDKLLPDVRFSRIDREERRLLFETPDGELPLGALSDGYQAMAAWCGDLLFQITENFQDYRDPLMARGLLLVDEIDLHLHPVWQRRLVSFIKETLPNVQVVVTTHSPLTIHQAAEGELFVLRRVGQRGAALFPFEGAPNRLMLHQLLASPLFGLETLDSPQVEEARDELRSLTGVGADPAPSSVATRERIDALKTILSDVPSWREARPGLERTNLVLEEVTRELARVTGRDIGVEDVARGPDDGPLSST